MDSENIQWQAYLNFVACDGRGTFHWELEDGGCGASQQVCPVDSINVGGLGEPFAGIPLPCQASMLRVVELDN